MTNPAPSSPRTQAMAAIAIHDLSPGERLALIEVLRESLDAAEAGPQRNRASPQPRRKTGR
jgi:hypothetical protein